MMVSKVLKINVKMNNSPKITNKKLLQKIQKNRLLIFINKILKMMQKKHKLTINRKKITRKLKKILGR
jgi:hypothetical protein